MNEEKFDDVDRIVFIAGTAIGLLVNAGVKRLDEPALFSRLANLLRQLPTSNHVACLNQIALVAAGDEKKVLKLMDELEADARRLAERN